MADPLVKVKEYLKEGSTWKNELGSIMTILKVEEGDGYFKGTYESSVGDAEDTYDLHGRFDNDGPTLGWVVSFQNQSRNANSTTTWSGHLLPDKPEKVIKTTWILTRTRKPECSACQQCSNCKSLAERVKRPDTTALQKTWNAQTIGQNDFTLQTQD